MTSMRDLVTDARVDNLHSVVDNGGSKFLCFTRLADNIWILCVSDGCDIWRLELDMDELDVHRDQAEINNLATYLASFKSSFTAGDIQVSQIGVKVNLSVGQGARTLNFELYEAKATDRRRELQNVLFRLAESASELERKLEKSQQELDSLKQHKSGPVSGAGVFDLDNQKKKNQPKVQAQKPGMSVFNPGSKKRKAARGVQFD